MRPSNKHGIGNKDEYVFIIIADPALSIGSGLAALAIARPRLQRT
jgi:hypothetical protein